MATKREKDLMKAMTEAARRVARGDIQTSPVAVSGHGEIDLLCHALNELMEALHSTREQYALVTDKISDVIWIMDMDLNFTYMSPSTERVHGRKPEEWLHMTLEDAVPLSSLETAMHVLAEELALQKTPGADRNRVRTLELEQYRKDGSTFWSEVKAGFVWGDSPEPIGIIGVTRDITDRKEAEQEWKRLTSILESTSDLVATATPEGTLTYLNAAGRRILGWEAPMDSRWQVLFSAHPQWAQRIVREEAIPTAIERGVWQGETAVLGPDGREIPVSQVIMAHRSLQGELLYLSTIMRDLSEYKRSEEALRESESTYRNMVMNSPVGMHFYRVEDDGRLVLEDANPAADEILGVAHAPLLGSDILDAFPRLAGTEVPDRYREAAVRGATWQTEQIFYQDERITGAFTVRAFQTKPGHMVADFVDITARKQAELELKESEERFRALHNASFGGIGIHEKGVILDCNQGLADITGYSQEELVGMNGLNLIAPEWRDHVMEKIVSGYDRAYEVRGLRKDGSTYPLEIHGKNIPYHGRTVRVTEFRDITASRQAEEEQQRLRDQLMQVQKMESVGQLAGGIAHDFNNMLVPIIGYAELLGDNLPPDDPRCAYVEEIVRSAERSRDLVRQLLAFARKQTLEMKPLNLNRIVENFQKMLRRALHENVTIQTGLSPDIGSIMADVGQVEQIILNLAVNAQDAMPGGGTLSISTSEVVLDESYTRLHEDLKPGPYVLMSISDTGTGMDRKTIPRIFDPFFTTKGPGKGTGLGLATVYGIVKQHGGNVSVYSEPGMGTSFKVYFPRHGELPAQTATERKRVGPVHGSEIILVVEDNDSVRELITSTLKGYGYTILSAPDGDAALRIAESCPKELALLITDVVLPSMNGKALYESLCSRCPSIRVLYMSGYTADVITHHGVLDSGVAFMQKPFSLLALAVKVRELLDGR